MAYFLIPVAILFEFGPFLSNSTRVWWMDGRTDQRTDGRTDGRTDRRTDTLSARTHLKTRVCSFQLHRDKEVKWRIYTRATRSHLAVLGVTSEFSELPRSSRSHLGVTQKNSKSGMDTNSSDYLLVNHVWRSISVEKSFGVLTLSGW